MGEQTDDEFNSSAFYSALNSKLLEVILDIAFLDEENLKTLENDLIERINVRYGDAIEETLRKDEQFSHLFKGFPPTSTKKIPESPLLNITNHKYSIVKRKNKFKQTNDLKTNITKSKNLHQSRKQRPAIDKRKVLVEYTNKKNNIQTTDSSNELLKNENCGNVSDQKCTKNENNVLSYFNMRNMFNKKLKATCVINNEENSKKAMNLTFENKRGENGCKNTELKESECSLQNFTEDYLQSIDKLEKLTFNSSKPKDIKSETSMGDKSLLVDDKLNSSSPKTHQESIQLQPQPKENEDLETEKKSNENECVESHSCDENNFSKEVTKTEDNEKLENSNKILEFVEGEKESVVFDSAPTEDEKDMKESDREENEIDQMQKRKNEIEYVNIPNYLDENENNSAEVDAETDRSDSREIDVEVLTEKSSESENSTEDDKYSVLVKVTYKKEKSTDLADSKQNDFEAKIKDAFKEGKNGNKKREWREMEEGSAKKYNLRSSLSNSKVLKKRARRSFGITEIVTRSRLSA